MKANYITPAVTPFDMQGNIDYEAMEKLYDFLIQGGIRDILILGSIGEFFAIAPRRKKEFIRLAVKHIHPHAQVLVGTASMDPDETVELSCYALEQGADAVMVISPYYFNLADDSIEEYYDRLAEKCPGNLYLYNFPERTGYDISPQVTLKLLRKHRNIAGYKDTLAGMDHTRELIKLIKPEYPDFKIYSGFDNNFTQNVLAGGDGCIAGLSNLIPEICSAGVKAFAEKNSDQRADVQKTIDRLMSIYQVGKPFIPYIKKAMIIRGIPIQEFCTFPLPRVHEEETQKLRRIMESAKIIESSLTEV